MTAININAAMTGLSPHTKRAYRRWLSLYLRSSDLNNVRLDYIVPKLNVVGLRTLLGYLKTHNLGKQSLGQAKAAIVWLARHMAELGHVGYDVPASLSALPVPRAEAGQRPGVWLSQVEARQLLRSLLQQEATNPARTTRDTAIIILMVTCGLRRDEISTANWSDLGRQGGQTVLRVHGKGEKMRIVKLPDMAVQAIENWRQHHPISEGERAIFSRIWKNGRVTTTGITDRVIWTLVRTAAVNAGLPSISPHDLRRTFARGAYEAGASLELIRQALGHSNIATTERYVNATLELNRAATDIWADALEM